MRLVRGEDVYKGPDNILIAGSSFCCFKLGTRFARGTKETPQPQDSSEARQTKTSYYDGAAIQCLVGFVCLYRVHTPFLSMETLHQTYTK
jgi:hypothetical protein